MNILLETVAPELLFGWEQNLARLCQATRGNFSFLKKSSNLCRHLMKLQKPFLDPTASAGRVLSYKIGSAHSSFRLSVSFLGICSLGFSEPWHGVRDPYIVVFDRAGYFGKNPHLAKMTKKVKNAPKTGFSDFLRKSCY